MFSSPTFAIGIALIIAVGLVCFGIGRLMKHFQDEFRKDNSLKETSYPLDTADKRH
jgi:hypothetical protein